MFKTNPSRRFDKSGFEALSHLKWHRILSLTHKRGCLDNGRFLSQKKPKSETFKEPHF